MDVVEIVGFPREEMLKQKKQYEPDVSQMQGSEKQIAWAKSVLRRTRALMDSMEESLKDDPGIKSFKNTNKTIISNMEKLSAGEIIEHFRMVDPGVEGNDKYAKGRNYDAYKTFAALVKLFEKETKKSLRKSPLYKF